MHFGENSDKDLLRLLGRCVAWVFFLGLGSGVLLAVLVGTLIVFFG